MNMEIYNKEVASLQKHLNELERNILNGKQKMATILDFNDLKKEITYLKNEYTSIYYNMVNEVSRKQLLEFLKHETNFLDVLIAMFDSLSHYHDVIGFVENYEIEQEWNDVRTIINYNNFIKNKLSGLNILNYTFKKIVDPKLENKQDYYNEYFTKGLENAKQLEIDAENAKNRIIEISNTDKRINNRVIYSNEQISETQNRINLMSQEAIKSLDRFFVKAEIEEKEELMVDDNNKILDININDEYLNSLSIVGKIKYLKQVIRNIEKLKGKKVTIKYKDSKVRISSKYRARYIKCKSLLNRLETEYETIKEEALDEELKEEYAKVYASYKETEWDLFTLKNEALNYLNTNKVVAVASFNGEPFYVLKNNLDKFNKVFVNYKKLQLELKKTAKKCDIEIIDNGEKLESINDLEEKLYEELYTLEDSERTTENTEKIAALKKELYKLNKGKKYALFANVKVLLKTFALTNDLKKAYTNIILNPNNLVENKEYAVSEKKEYLKDIISKIKLFTEHQKSKLKVNTQKVKEIDEEKPTILEVQVKKIKRALEKLPTNKNNLFKIKNIRMPKDKKKIIFATSAACVLCCATVGIASFSSSKSIDTKQEEITSSKYYVEQNTLFSEPNSLSIESSKKEQSTIFDLDNVLNSSNSNENANISKPISVNVENKKQEKSTSLDINNVVNNNIFKETVKEPIKDTLKTEEKVQDKDNISVNYSTKDSIDEKIDDTNIDVDIDLLEEAPTYMDAYDSYHDFGETFKTSGSVYQTATDVVNKTNPLNPYFGSDTNREVVGIVYDYNGKTITIKNSDVDAEAKKNALENNHAIQVGFLSKNEESMIDGYEGFFNDEDVFFTINDDLTNNEGRGR